MNALINQVMEDTDPALYFLWVLCFVMNDIYKCTALSTHKYLSKHTRLVQMNVSNSLMRQYLPQDGGDAGDLNATS